MESKDWIQNKSKLLTTYPPSRFISTQLWEVIGIAIRRNGKIRKRVKPPALHGNLAHSLVSILIEISLLVKFTVLVLMA
jgi:hypothetical protein